MNTRRKQFRDPRVREALIHAFDFEWTNKTIMYGAYARTHFAVPEFGHDGDRVCRRRKNSNCSSRSAARCRTKCSASPSCRRCLMARGRTARLLRKASQLLSDAGCVVKDGKRLLPNGELFKIEFLLDEPSFQPHHAPYIKNLGTLGIEASLRLVDAVQYRARVEDFDFDMTIERFRMSATPGDSMRPFFSSQAAATKGSYNLAGVADPAIDALIEKIIGGRHPRRADDRLPRLRPRVPRRALLGAAMVPHHPSAGLLGCVRPPAKAAALSDRQLFIQRRGAHPVVV